MDVDELFNCFEEENEERPPDVPIVLESTSKAEEKSTKTEENENEEKACAETSLKRVLSDEEEAGETSKKPRIESVLDDIK